MSSLYNISEDLFRLFDEIEENGGEITEEQEELLNIKQDELKAKLDNYQKAVSSWQGDVASCKEEEKRIKATRARYEHRIEYLKSAMLHAVQQFGEHGKTNMFIELPTCRLSTRASNSVEVNEERVKILINKFDNFIREVVSQGVLYTGENVDLKGIIDTINAQCKAEYGDDFLPFNVADLLDMNINISFRGSIASFLIDKGNILEQYGKSITATISNDTTKDEWKAGIEDSIEVESDINTIAKIKQNQSLQIK